MAATFSAKGPQKRRSRGFRQAAALVEPKIRDASSRRGFSMVRLLTRWPEIVGPEIAAQARPVKVSYTREGLGATLVLLTSGAAAPILQMRLPEIQEKVNACYGYSAIARVRLTQTAATGFAEGEQAPFTAAPKRRAPPEITPETRAAAGALAGDVSDAGLRDALAALAANVMTRTKR